MRVLFLSIGALFSVATILFAARQWGLSKPVKVYDSAYMRWEGLAVAVPWSPGFTENNVNEIRAASGLQEVILWAPLRENEVKEIVVGEGDGVSLPEFLRATSPHKIALDVRSNTPNIDLKISDAIPEGEDERVFIQSPYDVVLRAIKLLRPRMVFGTSNGEATRLLVLDSLWILPAANVKGDALWSALDIHDGVELKPTVVAEIRRRKKKVWIGPLRSKEDIARALTFGPDVVILESSDLAMHLKAF